MEPKEYLSLARMFHDRYRRALDEVETIRSLMMSTGAIRYDKDTVQKSPSNDAMANYMIRLEKAEANAWAASEIYFDVYTRIRNQIEQITPGLYSDVLYLRYIKGMRLIDICDELGYDYGWVRQLHGRALQAFGKKFPEIKNSTQ